MHRLRVHNRDGVHLHPLPHAEGKQEQTGAGQQVIWQTFFKTKRDDQKFKLVCTFRSKKKVKPKAVAPAPTAETPVSNGVGSRTSAKVRNVFLFFFVQVNCVAVLFFGAICCNCRHLPGRGEGPFSGTSKNFEPLQKKYQLCFNRLCVPVQEREKCFPYVSAQRMKANK